MNWRLFPSRSLKTRVTLVTLGIFIVSFWSLSLYVSRVLHKDIEQLLAEQQAAVVAAIAADINAGVEDRIRGLESLAARITPALLRDRESLQSFLESRSTLPLLFNSGLWITGPDGVGIADLPRSTGRIGVDYSDREFMIGALRGKSTIGKPVIGRQLKAPAFAIATPINDEDGKVIGVLLGAINLGAPNFLDRITDRRHGKTGHFRLVSREHRLIITTTDKSLIMEPLPPIGANPVIENFVQGNEGSTRTITSQGTEVLVAAKQIPAAGWYVAGLLPTQEAFSPIYDIQKRVQLAAAFLTLLAGGLTWWMLRRELAPMVAAAKLLTSAADSNQPTPRLHISHQDEIGKLIGGFNRLLETLKKREDSLKTSENQFRIISSITSDILYSCHRSDDGVFRVDWIAGDTEKLFECDIATIMVRGCWRPFVVQEDLPLFEHCITDIQPGQTKEAILRIAQRDGSMRYIHSISKLDDHSNGDGVHKLYGALQDITESKRAEEKISQLAFFDQLTGLPNRTLLQDRLKQAMASGERNRSFCALLLIDLDHFKTLNDTLGHDMGDLLLKQVAQRLIACVREEDTVARLGGDEFVVMLVSLGENQREAASAVSAIGKKISEVLCQTYMLRDASFDVTPSIGASVFLGHEIDIDTLLKQADLAMYKAKSGGRNALRFFDPDMAHEVFKRASLENDLRAAVQKNQFVLHYQAQVAEGQITGVEALLRWQHPERGLVPPGEFISVIEETGLILPVGQWVLETACKQLAEWATHREMTHLTVAVNISALQLHHDDFVHQVLMILERSGANPNRLKLELTESLLVNNVEDTIGKMTALKTKGVAFSLDDFGTGFSSLSYLKRLPLDQLKIDQSFVRDILVDPNDAAIAKMIVVLAESLGLAVIAEGVETESQRDALKQHGCRAYQGYLFSRPLPIDEFELFVKRV